MAGADHVAGHPIAIRVGGRRMSQSNPIRSPTKTQQPSSTSSSPEDNVGSGVAEVPDYPRPRSPAKTTDASANMHTDDAAQPQPDVNNGSGGSGGGNRQERRRQERKREKSHRDEEGKSNGQGTLSQNNDAMFNHLRKGMGERVNRNTAQSGANGVRITQPAQKFMV